MPTVMAGTNFVLHAASWMEGGLVADFAKLVLDADQLTMVPNLVNGIGYPRMGRRLMRCAKPAHQHFLGSSHTQANFECVLAVVDGGQ